MKNGISTTKHSTPPAWANRLVETLLHRWLMWVLVALFIFVGLPFLAPVAMAAGWTKLGEVLYFIYAPFCHQLPQRSWFLFGEQLTFSLDEIYSVYPYEDAWGLRRFFGTTEMGWKVAWSDRMISFYGMIPVFGLVYAALRHRLPARRPLPRLWFAWALVPLFVDGVTHAFNDLLYGFGASGFRDTNTWLAYLTGNAFPGFYAGDHLGTFNWWMRLLSGLLAAWAIAFFTFPRLDALFHRELRRHRRQMRQTQVG